MAERHNMCNDRMSSVEAYWLDCGSITNKMFPVALATFLSGLQENFKDKVTTAVVTGIIARLQVLL